MVGLDINFSIRVPSLFFFAGLIVAGLDSQIMPAVLHRSLVFVSVATIHHELTGFVLHFGDYIALTVRIIHSPQVC